MNSAPSNQFDYSMATLPGIAVAGMAYPLVVFGIALASSVFYDWFSVRSVVLGLSSEVVLLVITLFALCLIGLFVALMSGITSLLMLNAINESIGNPLSPVALISCGGGLAGFVPMSLVLRPTLSFDLSGYIAIEGFVIALAAGPCLASLLGQTGARWWERNRARKILCPPVIKNKMQFRIGHMLMATFWFGLLLGLAQIITINGWLVLIYIMWQTVLLGSANLIDKFRNNSNHTSPA